MHVQAADRNWLPDTVKECIREPCHFRDQRGRMAGGPLPLCTGLAIAMKGVETKMGQEGLPGKCSWWRPSQDGRAPRRGLCRPGRSPGQSW